MWKVVTHGVIQSATLQPLKDGLNTIQNIPKFAPRVLYNRTVTTNTIAGYINNNQRGTVIIGLPGRSAILYGVREIS